jgi:hypothetical protein
MGALKPTVIEIVPLVKAVGAYSRMAARLAKVEAGAGSPVGRLKPNKGETNNVKGSRNADQGKTAGNARNTN